VIWTVFGHLASPQQPRSKRQQQTHTPDVQVGERGRGPSCSKWGACTKRPRYMEVSNTLTHQRYQTSLLLCDTYLPKVGLTQPQRRESTTGLAVKEHLPNGCQVYGAPAQEVLLGRLAKPTKEAFVNCHKGEHKRHQPKPTGMPSTSTIINVRWMGSWL
jgi:hypothetical protein